MKTVMVVVLSAVALFCTPVAKAWNCSDPLASRVDVGSTRPSGIAGDGDGQYYIGPDAQNPNDYYVCQVPKPTPTPSTPGVTSSSTSSASSASNSSSNSASNATGGNSSSTATGGNQKQKQNQTQTANGGNASATGGNSASSASNNGNGSNDASYQSTTTVAASKIPVATAIAPPSGSTNTCFKGFGAGVQSAFIGGSFGGGKIDTNCAILEASLKAPSLIARCKVYISDKYVKQAGVTLEDCLNQPAVEPEPVVSAPTPVQPVVPEIVVPAPQVTINLAAPVAPAPVVVTPVPAPVVPAAKQRHKRKPCTDGVSKVWTNDNLPTEGE